MKKILTYGLIAILSLIAIYLFYPKKGITGIDVSHHNDNVVEYVYSNKVNFMIAKASEGKSFQDKRYKLHRRLAQIKNIKFGAYHFLNFNTPARAQFENFKKVVKKHHLDIRPVLDVELYGNKQWPETKHLRSLVKEFGELCREEYGCYPIIYCNESFKARYFLTGFQEYPIWICNYVTNNINNCEMQQYKIDSKYNIDLNKIYNPDRIYL